MSRSKSASAKEYDAILYLSFGGPESSDDVMPYLRRVTAKRNIPDARLEEVAEHYYHFGGKSPINNINRQVIAALEAELAAHSIDLPVYFANRNWHPLVEDTVIRMKQDGMKQALAFATSAYPGYSGCLQYVEDLTRAIDAAGGGIKIDKIRTFSSHPDFIRSMSVPLAAYVAGNPGVGGQRILFSAHSVPLSMAQKSSYAEELKETAELIMSEAGLNIQHELVYQSRSGSPSTPWLGPDILEAVQDAANQGVKKLIVVPSGFVSDHMEVLYDLDIEARELAGELGVEFFRLPTAGTSSHYISMIRQLIQEHIDPDAQTLSLGSRGVRNSYCPCGICEAPTVR